MLEAIKQFDYPQPEIQQVRSLLFDPSVPKVMDFDDTVAKTSHQFQRTSVEIAFEKLGIRVQITPEYGATHLRGKTGRDIMSTILSSVTRNVDENIVDELTRMRNAILVKLVKDAENVSEMLTPGMTEVVRVFRTTHQQAAIATQSPETFVRAFVQKAEVDGTSIADTIHPRLVTGASVIERAERRYGSDHKILRLGKPDAISVVHGAKKIVPDAKHILYIGDSEVDAKTVAGQENITGVIVNSNPAKREQLRREFSNAGNIIVIGSLEELFYE